MKYYGIETLHEHRAPLKQKARFSDFPPVCSEIFLPRSHRSWRADVLSTPSVSMAIGSKIHRPSRSAYFFSLREAAISAAAPDSRAAALICTAQKLRESRLAHNYDRSAQVLDVFLRHRFCTTLPITVDNFVCTHSRFENPQYLIDNENITLMTISDRDAVFCETEEKGTPIRHIHESTTVVNYARFPQMTYL